MIAYILYAPLALATAVLLGFAARGAARGYGNGRLVPLAIVLVAALSGSLYLMFGVGEAWGRWAAVGLVAAVTGPLLAPVTLLLVAAFVSWLGGKPMRWN